ncbi:MAG: ATP-grasp domain-containing protein [Actinomycetota bacterium]|nr:ATP-grasp domain-containing protein [Actinomycetota bacterium]
MSQEAPPALLIMTSLKMIIRHLRMVEYADELGLTPIMVFGGTGELGQLRRLMADPDHPLCRLGALWPVAGPSVDSVIAGVRRHAGRYDIRGVISCGEYYVEPAAALAQLLGLPGTGWPAATISRNKLLQRFVLPEYAPRWWVLDPASRSDAGELESRLHHEIEGSLVIKPTRRMSSSGVCELPSAAGLAAVLDSYPADETLLVEQRVIGPEFSVETLVQHGSPLWSGVTGKQTNEGAGGFVETAHTVPAAGLSAAQLAELNRANTEVLARLDLRDGVAHAEFRLTEHGPVLMEVALRVPGGGISVLWGLATGSSMEERLVELAIGRPVRYPAPRRQARHLFLDNPTGRLADVRSEFAPVSWTVRELRWPELPPASAERPAQSRAVLVSKLAGDELGPLVDGDARAVSLIVDAPLGADLEREVSRAHAGIDIVVQ